MGCAPAWCCMDKYNEANLHWWLHCISAESNSTVPVCHQVQHLGFSCVTSPEETETRVRHSKVSLVSLSASFSQWAARLLFPISLPVVLRAEAWWPRAAESVMHINSADAAPGLSHARDSALHPNSLRGTLQGSFQTPPSMEGGSKGSWETDVPLMQTQIFLMSSVELNQLHQQRKFSFFPRAEMVSCSLAHPCPAWALY